MEHKYHWTKTSTGNDTYTITWYDDQTVLCSTQTKIIGPAAEVETALSLAAEQLRKENAALFPDQESGEDIGISTMSIGEEVYG